LTDATIAAAGLYCEADGDHVKELLGNYLSVKNARKMGPCLVFPYTDRNGEPMVWANGDGIARPFVRIKPAKPRADKRKKGKFHKYESPAGSTPRAYFPPSTRAALGDASIPLLITEGEKKGLAADQYGFPCIALGGVWSWQAKREENDSGEKEGPRELIPDLESVAWQGRSVYIVFDSDRLGNPLVLWAEWHLAERLKSCGAVVRIVAIPTDPNGAKQGLDDFLVASGPDELRKLIEAATEPTKPASGGSFDAPDDPHRLAERILDGISPGGWPYLLRSWRGEFWLWNKSSYRLIDHGDFQARLANLLRCELVRMAAAAVKKSQTPKVTNGLVRDVTLALRGLVLLPSSIDAPAWIDGMDGPDANAVMPMANGLLDLEVAANGLADGHLPPDRSFFTTTAAPFRYDPCAPRPAEWLKFLNQLWPDDRQSIETLQEWFGLLLTPDTRQQKILFLLGPKRSGKGTIIRILRSIIGEANTCGPTFASLATNFGLWPLLGKSVAIVSDARLSGRTDAAVVTERLLSISGEDSLTIDRKHREAVTCKLNTRFVILSNELPRLGDASGALAGRLILLRLKRSWFGMEDHHLFDRLRGELPGILLWAIEGWKRLRARGRFVQPDSGQELVEDCSWIV
jgi:putative DNA primase/helicase